MTIHDRPPAGWKRPPIPSKVKLQVILNQDGRSKICGERLGLIDNVHFDHRPALWERKFDTAAGDTIPPANDPAFIEAITIKQHDTRTHGPGGTTRITTRGSDSGNRAKDRAVIAKQAVHRDAMKNKGRNKKGKKSKSKLQSASSFPTGRKFPVRPKKNAERSSERRTSNQDSSLAAGTDIRERRRSDGALQGGSMQAGGGAAPEKSR